MDIYIISIISLIMDENSDVEMLIMQNVYNQPNNNYLA
jgi:hypothetical protein